MPKDTIGIKNLYGLTRFLPLLALYVVIIAVFSSDTLIGDETRHIEYAENLSNGFYSKAENPEIRNGPGYPLILAPFTQFNVPFIVVKLLNAIFLVLAVLFFYKTVSLFLEKRKALVAAYFLGCYPPFLKWIVFMDSETFAVFLACGFLYYYIATLKLSNTRIHLVLAATFLGVLALTKVIFGYVIITLAILYLVIYLFRPSKKAKLSLLILAGGFLFCIPFLAYTYSLTGKALYWGSQGGEILYWRSSPIESEYGDWISADVVMGKDKNDFYEYSTIAKNHQEFFKSLEPYSYVERDIIFKEKALENIEKYPYKYFKNTMASGLRLFFNYPYSYTQQKPSTFYYIIPNGLLLVLLVVAAYLSLIKPRVVSFEVRFVGMMALITIGGLVLANGLVRYLLPVIPFLFFYVLYVLKRTIRISIKELPEGSAG